VFIDILIVFTFMDNVPMSTFADKTGTPLPQLMWQHVVSRTRRIPLAELMHVQGKPEPAGELRVRRETRSRDSPPLARALLEHDVH
jgi:hypothetical protein